MSSLEQLLEERAGLPEDAVERVQALISDWQILSDLAFADLLLCVRDPSTSDVVVVAQMRPYTAQTVTRRTSSAPCCRSRAARRS